LTLILVATALSTLWATTLQADPKLPDWLGLDAEYRVQTRYIDPLELNGLTARSVHYTQQRFRLETSLMPIKQVAIVSQIDMLGGVLFGDNGYYGGDPAPNSGLALTSRFPNHAGWTVGPVDGGDPFNPDDYGLVLRGIEPIHINYLYGKVVLPFGLLQVGRQPATTGPGINLHDGSRTNRWGVSSYAPAADRFLFATKLDEAILRIARGKKHKADNSMDNGVFLGFVYDIAVEDSIGYGGDNLHQLGGLIQWKAVKPRLFGWDWDSFLLQVSLGGRFGDPYKTRLSWCRHKKSCEYTAHHTQVLAGTILLEVGAGPVHFSGELIRLGGHTREISEGMAALRESDEAMRVVHDQDILAYGARGILDIEVGPVTGTLEFDYASGDADPRDDTRLTTFNYSRDANVGLLLFEHILAFETARSAGVGIENLQNVGAKSFPLTELSSEGRVHNAIIAFPQVLYRPWESFHVRLGALFAWSAAPVTDSIMTLLSEDGNQIKDDAVNWHGGKPARYYGTEFDLQLEWRYRKYFQWTVESAVLVPGAALQDEAGDAVPSFLIENRFTFIF
jgi:hypothetical protein